MGQNFMMGMTLTHLINGPLYESRHYEIFQ